MTVLIAASSTSYSPAFVIGAFAVVVLLLSFWHGWAAGFPRMLLELASFVLASATAWTFHSTVGGWIGALIPLPEFLLSVIGGVIIGSSVVLIFKVVSFALLKKTGHYKFPVRQIFGLGGGALGLVEGILVVAMGLLLVRATGTLAEIQVAAQSKAGEGAPPNRLLLGLAEIKKSVDTSMLGKMFAAVDPVPPVLYVNVKRLDTVLREPVAMDRFFAYPQTKELFSDPKLMALMEDPKLREKFAERRLDKVALSKPVMEALNDPEVRKKLVAFPWSAALEYAAPDAAAKPEAAVEANEETPPEATPAPTPVLRRINPL